MERTNEDRRMVEFEHDWLMSCLELAIKPRFEAIVAPT